MKKYRQWLADTNQMTESPDGTHYLVTDVEKMEAEKDRVIQESCVIIAEGIKVVENLEQQIAALEAVVKFNKYELAEKKKYILELEAALHEWQDIAGQWEDKCQKLTEQIAALQGEISRLYTITVEQSKQIATLTTENKRLRDFREREAVLIKRLQSHGDIETDKEENALKGKEGRDDKESL